MPSTPISIHRDRLLTEFAGRDPRRRLPHLLTRRHTQGLLHPRRHPLSPLTVLSRRSHRLRSARAPSPLSAASSLSMRHILTLDHHLQLPHLFLCFGPAFASRNPPNSSACRAAWLMCLNLKVQRARKKSTFINNLLLLPGRTELNTSIISSHDNQNIFQFL